jgi:hypothetical protein
MLKPARGRSDEAGSFNPRNEGPLIAGDSWEAGGFGRVLTTGAIGGVAACAGVGTGGGKGFDARCDGGAGFSAADTSVAPHMLQKRFVA